MCVCVCVCVCVLPLADYLNLFASINLLLCHEAGAHMEITKFLVHYKAFLLHHVVCMWVYSVLVGVGGAHVCQCSNVLYPNKGNKQIKG